MREIFNSTAILKFRSCIARIRSRLDPYYQIRQLSKRFNALAENACYEFSPDKTWQPKHLGLEETLRKIIDERLSVARYGDEEFGLMAGKNMSFELANSELALRLRQVLKEPCPKCLNCVVNIFGSLARYRPSDIEFWRNAAIWMRPILMECVPKATYCGDVKYVYGDPMISRAYLGVGDPTIADHVFKLWKELFFGKEILIVEGRFSRIGIGNDLLAGAKGIKRIWCPAKGAFAKYEEIKNAVLKHATQDELILIALGASATILAYDLSKLGYWAIDAGHVDVEYMWMQMGAKEKCPIPGRYVNECLDRGREMIKVEGEEAANNVVEVIS